MLIRSISKLVPSKRVQVALIRIKMEIDLWFSLQRVYFGSSLAIAMMIHYLKFIFEVKTYSYQPPNFWSQTRYHAKSFARLRCCCKVSSENYEYRLIIVVLKRLKFATMWMCSKYTVSVFQNLVRSWFSLNFDHFIQALLRFSRASMDLFMF